MKKYLFGLITGLLISGGVVFASKYLYKADEVSYDAKDTTWNVDNVDSAIKSLYSMINEVNSSLTDLKNTDIAKAVGANGNSFESVISKLGEIVNRGAWSTNVTSNGSVTIPRGFHDGTGKVNVNIDSSVNLTRPISENTTSTGNSFSIGGLTVGRKYVIAAVGTGATGLPYITGGGTMIYRSNGLNSYGNNGMVSVMIVQATSTTISGAGGRYICWAL